MKSKSRQMINKSSQSLKKRGILLALLGLMPAVQFFGLQKPALAAFSCAVPGKDGSSTGLTGIVNTYYPGTASASAGATSISVGTPTGSTTAISAGDLLLVIQMQDAAIDSSNSVSYGNGSSGSGSTTLNNSGVYEYVVANGSVSGGSISLRSGLINSYTNAAATTSQGQRRFQVIRVPQYFNATLSSGLTAARWNGSTGGILAIDVAGTLQGNSATVSVDGLGFRGGGARQLAGGTGGSATDYRSLATSTFHASKGEGIAGTPRYTYTSGTTIDDNLTEGYPSGSFARGAPGNAGGGGSDNNPSANDQNTGGGGGSNGGTGGRGGFSWSTVVNAGGLGGAAFSGSASRLILGGGGGAGTRNNSAGVQSSGGTGGGIIFIRTGQLAGAATLSANGSSGIAPDNDGGGGGGAGGSLAVTAFGGNGSVTLNARGGSGANAWPTSPPGTTDELTVSASNNRHGPGGGGGGGYIVQPSNADGFSGSVNTTVTGGVNGTSTTALNPFGATPGNSGVATTASGASIPGVAAGAQCLFTVSGTVFNDTDGGTINGTGTNAGSSTLTAYLVSTATTPLTVATATVNATNGTYSFPAIVPGNYTVRLSNIATGAVGAAPPAASLPSGYVNTGEGVGATPTTADGTADGITPITIGTANLTNVNFGIEQPPTAVGGTAATQANPGGTTSVAVPSTLFTSSTDPSPGTITSYRITAFPTNATSITLNNGTATTTYTSATFPVVGVTVPVAQLGATQVDPIDGTVSVVLSFRAIDNAGQLSANTATATIPFGGSPQLLLVKRITAINGSTTGRATNGAAIDLSQFSEDSGTTADNNAFWPSGFLSGAINGGVARPDDEVEYTIYFLSSGGVPATNVKLCDRIPNQQTFVLQGYTSLPAASGGDGSSRGIAVSYNGTYASHTNLNDGDTAQYYERGVVPLPAVCGGNLNSNPTGAVVINLGQGATESAGGSIPNATTTPNTNTATYGFIRFKAKVD